MFPTSLEHPYQQSRGRRRGRNEPNNRDYICPCGKSYLSYPALFTHIKIKHNGRVVLHIYRPQDRSSSPDPSTLTAEDVPKQYYSLKLRNKSMTVTAIQKILPPIASIVYVTLSLTLRSGRTMEPLRKSI